MSDGINVKIHMYEYLKLGGEWYWDWKQDYAAGPYWRLYWNSCGGGFVKVNRREVELTPDRMVLLAPNTIYSTRTVSETGHLYMHFSADRPLADVPPQMFELKYSHLTDQAAQLSVDIPRRRDGWKTMLRMQVLINSTLLSLPEYAVPPLRQYDPRVAQAIAIIETSAQTVSNSDLAHAVNMSINGFLQLFSEQVGIPPQTYSRRKRLNDASKMLHFNEAAIEDIAIASGFCDRYHFTRAFKQEFGVGPAQFRRQGQMLRDAAGKGRV